MNNIMNKRGNVATVEFVIIIVILTFFIFFPFAIYSSYSQKNVLENIKDRGLHLTASKGAPDDEVIKSLMNEFEFYGLEPKEGEQIIIRFYKLSLTDNDMETEDTSVYEIKKEGESLNFEQFGEMSKALKENKDIIRITIEYPADNFLNSILGLIYGKKEGDEKVLTNSNATGAAYSIAVSGFIMSEYSDKIGQNENNSDSFEIRAGDHILTNLVIGFYDTVGKRDFEGKYYPIPNLRFVANANGTYRVRYSIECDNKYNPAYSNDFRTKIYINGTATTHGGRVRYNDYGPKEYTHDLTAQEGDVVELWGRLENEDFEGRVNYFYIQIDAPFLPDYRVRG